MAWIEANIVLNTNNNDTVGVVMRYEDVAEFPASDPFIYRDDRVDVTGGAAALKTAANAALDAERSRRQLVVGKETQLLTFMNT